MLKNDKSRDAYIVEEYAAGADVPEFARQNGISNRRVQQILKDAQVPLRGRTLVAEKAPVSRLQERIGLHLSTFMLKKGSQPNEVANDLGWSLHKVRMVQRGLTDLELLDLLDLSTYTKTERKPTPRAVLPQ